MVEFQVAIEFADCKFLGIIIPAISCRGWRASVTVDGQTVFSELYETQTLAQEVGAAVFNSHLKAEKPHA